MPGLCPQILVFMGFGDPDKVSRGGVGGVCRHSRYICGCSFFFSSRNKSSIKSNR